MSSSFFSELDLAFILLLYPPSHTTEAAPICIISHKTVFLKTPFVKMEIYSSALMTHWAGLDMRVLWALSFCLGPLPNPLGTFMSPSPETWGNDCHHSSIASQLSFTGFAVEAVVSRTLAVVLSLKSSIKCNISRYLPNPSQTYKINSLREEVLQLIQVEKEMSIGLSCLVQIRQLLG